VNIATCNITYFDSMQGNGDIYMNAILNYLQDDWKRTRGLDMPNVCQWKLENASSVPTQNNSYDCRVFVCLFATCMFLNISMDFDQNDAPNMRLHLAHLLYTHHQSQPSPREVTQSQQDEDEILVSTIDTNTPIKDIKDIPTPGSCAATNCTRQMGYASIMSVTDRPKRKFNFSSTSSRRKKKRMNDSCTTTQESRNKPLTSSTQSSIVDLFSSSQATRTKRRLDITDEDHPFKHKRFKEDSDE
jgi:hypothetical protein